MKRKNSKRRSEKSNHSQPNNTCAEKLTLASPQKEIKTVKTQQMCADEFNAKTIVVIYRLSLFYKAVITLLLVGILFLSSVIFFADRQNVEQTTAQISEENNNQVPLNSVSASPDVSDNSTTSLTEEQQQKVFTSLNSTVVSIPLMISFLILIFLLIVYQTPHSRSILIICGLMIVVFGVGEIFLLAQFDFVAVLILETTKANIVQKRIAFVSGILLLIQITIGINLLTQGLTLQDSTGVTKQLSRRIEELRAELNRHFL